MGIRAISRSAALSTTVAAAGLALGVVACGNGDDTTSIPPSVPADAAPDATQSKATDGEADSPAEAGPFVAPSTVAEVRFANWSADAPAIDFCLALHGTGDFRGPILGPLAAEIDDAGLVDGGSGALPFPKVSAYVPMASAQYDARVVVAGAADCSAKITEDATGLPPLTGGGFETIALLGAAHPQGAEPGLELAGFVDDWKPETAVLIRGINAAPDLPKADIQEHASAAIFSPLLVGIPFGLSSAGPADAGSSDAGSKIDANGYVQSSALTAATVDVFAAGGQAQSADGGDATALSSALNVTIGAGADVTLVVLDPTPGSTAMSTLQLLECVDNAGTAGLVSDCTTISN